MPIHPLPQFEADLEADRKIYEKLKPPTSIVVRFGIMKLVGEFPYSGDAKPGCGSKLVIRTNRGTEMGEMLTSTCPNSGCSKSVSRKEMLEYIENSGGKDYPFFNQGRILRIATLEDMNQQTKLDASRPKLVMEAREISSEFNLPMKIVDAEPILGGERLSFYFTSEDRVDFRDVVSRLASVHHTRIEMRQVGARDEARLVADYERCGQHCCCKQFLKVLKPISMKSAKIQKATLDPLKISGRCGRLMCCLRYEDETYDELRKRLPRKKSRVLTPSGWGYVIDAQILTQLVLIKLEDSDTEVAIPVEDLGIGPELREAGDDVPEGGDSGSGAGVGVPPARPSGRPARDERPARPSGDAPASAGAPQSPARSPQPAGPPQPSQDRRGDRGGNRGGERGGDRSRDTRGERPAQDRSRQGRPPQEQVPRDRRPERPVSGGPGGPEGSEPPRGGEENGPGGEGQRRRRRRRRRPGGGPDGAAGGPGGPDGQGGGSPSAPPSSST